MPDEPALLYLEPDDEITAAVRRLRDADGSRVVLVAPGRSKATSSTVALRLLQRLAADEGREVGVVGDALTRSLAAEAGLPAFASVEDARASVPSTPTEPRRAAIHVVRGDEPTAAVMPAVSPVGPPLMGSGDETRVVSVASARPRSGPAPRVRRPARRLLIVALSAFVALLVAAAGALAAVLPSATITVAPATVVVGPVTYELRFDQPRVHAGSVEATQGGAASGTYHDLVAATGVVTFRNFNVGVVSVPQGTSVAAGEIVFVTTQAVSVPPGQLTPEGTIAAGEASAGVAAAAQGPAGNVAAEAIDTILDVRTRNSLRGFPQNNARLVINYEATGGGVDASGPVVEQKDVDDALAALHQALADGVAAELAGTEGQVVADATPAPEPVISGVEGLVSTRDQPAFELSGELAYDRAAVERADVEAAARERLDSDPSAVPDGDDLLPGSQEVELGAARREGSALFVQVTVTARSARGIDTAAVADSVAGLPLDEARAALADLGDVRIRAWPDWVDAVPRLAWRISVNVADPLEVAPPSPSGSQAP